MNTSTVAKFIGESRDGRTNRWRVTCPACGHEFEPPTTRLRYQHMNCSKPKCGREMSTDYNAEPPMVKLAGDAPAHLGEEGKGE